MDEKTIYGILAVLFALAFLAVGAHDIWEQPEVVTEEVEIEVPGECEECEECEVCPVVDEELCSEFIPEEVDAEESVEAEVMDELEDNDFLEELTDELVSEGWAVDDEDDITEVLVKDYDLVWDDFEDGEASVEVELKVYFEEGNDADESWYDYLDVEFDVDELEVDSYSISA